MPKSTQATILYKSANAYQVDVPAEVFESLVAHASNQCRGTVRSGAQCSRRLGQVPQGAYSGKGLLVVLRDVRQRGTTLLRHYCWQHCEDAAIEWRVPPVKPELFREYAFQSRVQSAEDVKLERKPLASKSTNRAVKMTTDREIKQEPDSVKDLKAAQRASNQLSPFAAACVNSVQTHNIPQAPFTFTAEVPSSFTPFASSSQAALFGSKDVNSQSASGVSTTGKPAKLAVYKDQSDKREGQEAGKGTVKVSQSTDGTKASGHKKSVTVADKALDLSEHLCSHTAMITDHAKIKTTPTQDVSSQVSKTSPSGPTAAPSDWEQMVKELRSELTAMRALMEQQQLTISTQQIAIQSLISANKLESQRNEREADKPATQESDGGIRIAEASSGHGESENEKVGLVGEPSDVRTRPSMSMSHNLRAGKSSSSTSADDTRSGLWKSLDAFLCGCNFGRKYEEI